MTATPPSDRLPSAEKGVTDSPEAPGSPRPEPREQDPTDTVAEETRTEPSNEEQEEGEAESEPAQDNDEDKEPGEAEESAPPLPDEVPPPLPDEAPPGEDDGWEPVWDATQQAYYFYNRFTGVSQWHNPRVPDVQSGEAAGTGAGGGGAPGVEESPSAAGASKSPQPVVGGYNPAIHGDYDPTAPYAQQYEPQEVPTGGPVPGGLMDPNAYEATGTFNRFTGKWQAASQNPENYNDENKSRRQMYAFFDVDAAANSHDGRSLRAERSAKKLSRAELKAFKEKRKEKKEEKRRAWLRD